MNLEFVLFDSGDLHEMPEQTYLQRMAPVNWQRNALRSARKRIDVMAAFNAGELPPSSVKQLCEFRTRNGFHGLGRL